jgi:hypothetical protein
MKTTISAISPLQVFKRDDPGSFDRDLGSPGMGGFRQEAVTPTLSSYWRKNTSSLEAVEMANLLRALRKVAGHLGENIGRIEFSGMSTDGKHGILIEPETVMGQYPVPADKVDFLVGLVVHQAIHRMEWSDHVWKVLEPVMAEMMPRAMVIFQKLVRIGESIFMDLCSDQTVFGFYTKIARDKAIGLDRCRFFSDRPCIDTLMTLWWDRAFSPDNTFDVPVDYETPFEELTLLTRNLKAISQSAAKVTHRCDQRISLYQNTWIKLEPAIISWKIMDKHLFWFFYPKSPGVEKKQSTRKLFRKTKALPLVLARDIERRLCSDSVDLTPLIRSVAGYENETVAPMSHWDFHAESRPVVDRKMVGRLRAVFAHYAERNTLTSRGLAGGRIDRRRLYRVAVGGRCFKSIHRIPNLDWGVGLLVDASGSMRGSKWQLVENTIATIHKALSGYQNRLSAWAYFEVSGICMISRLIAKNRLFSVPPAGQTASGQAIIAAASMMPKNVQRNLLIHITDGESNFGCDVSYGLEYCRLRKIQLITLGCGYKNRPAMERQYGRAIEFIDYFEQLPKAMETLFKWIFIYGNGKNRFPHTRSKDCAKGYAHA